MNKRKLLYIIAPSYSGSTLLTILLSKLPQIATIGELKASRMGDVKSYMCSCGRPILSCEFWNEVTRRCNERGLEFSVSSFNTILGSGSAVADKLIRARVRSGAFEAVRRLLIAVMPGLERNLESGLGRNQVIADVVCEIQGKDVFLDGSKSPARLLHFLRSRLWDTYVINLVRDGRGVANSLMNHLSITMPVAAKRWMVITSEIDCMLKKIPSDRRITVMYENLCSRPEETLNSIARAFGLSQVKFEHWSLKDGGYHILGNSMRLNSTSEIRFDESWRLALSDADIADFSRIAGRRNRSHGYG